MQSLVICDDTWHPAKTVRQGLAPLEGDNFAFHWIADAGQWSSECLDEYPVVILTKSNNTSSTNPAPWMTEEIEQAFLNYVHQGGGLLVIHSGSAGYQETRTLRALMGGVFLEHPPQCPVAVQVRPEHPITTGSAPFAVTDEHYFMAQDDSTVDHFLASISQHGEQSAGWTRLEGKGRVCMLTPGHNPEVWLEPSYQMIIRNALRWCSHEI
jgi:uncharacterized protein